MAVRYVEIGQYPDVRREVRGNLSEILVATANPGTYAAPEDVAGCTLEMGADGLWTGASVGTLTQEQADALVASGVLAGVKPGTLATVSGVPYSWSGSAWVAVGGGSAIIPCFDTIAARDAAYPTPSLGQKACIKRLCGNGYFEMSYEGTRWAVRPGESIIRDTGGIGVSSGYAYTAVSTSFVQLASYTIPAGLVGDGEAWGFTVAARNAGVYVSGSDACQIKIASSTVTTLTAASAVNRGGRSEASYIRRSAGLIGNSGTSSPFAANTANGDPGIDMGIAQIISVNASAGAITNTMNVSEFGAYRKL